MLGVAAAACGVVILLAQPAAGPYTAEQAAAGRAAYQTNCAACHAPDLSGREGPQLAGANFLSQWGDRTTGELIGFLRSTMPPGAGGSLSDQTYVDLAAFILDANSARAGARPLTIQSSVSIRSVASGQRNVVAQPKQEAPIAQAPRGITVAGEVKNYVPVTDAMLRNPDPADWLMLRHDYKASYYSPLNQITTQNVNQLRLVWSWAMQEGVSNGSQPAPIVHNGVLYVNNAGMVLQALDAKTGELIWENRYGSDPNAPAMRGIAIYGDKLFVATGEAHLLAFDARTGKLVWDTAMGDRSQGDYSSSSGPLAVKGKLIQGPGRDSCGVYRQEKCFIGAYDWRPAKKRGAFGPSRWKVNREAIPGGASQHFPRGGGAVDHRKLRSGLERSNTQSSRHKNALT